MNVILASQSPRRKQLMEVFPFPFTVRVSDADETMDPHGDPASQVARVSLKKAEAVAHQWEDVVIAADTIVVCGGEILGKPKDAEDACRMLRLLSGKKHQVMTGLTVLHQGKAEVSTEITDIYFRALTDEEIWRYVKTNEPMDKAGAYAIQGGGALFAEKIVGDYFNVVGLPLCRLGQVLKKVVPQLTEETT